MSVCVRYRNPNRPLFVPLTEIRVVQVASEIQGLDLQRFKEATWEDRLTIIVIFYELLTSKRDLEELLELRGTRAQFMLDLMQDAIRTHPDFVHVLRGGTPRIRGARRNFLNGMKELGLLRNIDRASAHLDARRLIVQLSEVSDLLPSVLGIHGVDNVKPTALGGAFGDIYTADYQGQHVALKRLRFFQAEGDESHKIRQKFRREALIWKNLEHDYVLPFLGVDSETFPEFLCMVSPWMERGSLTSRSGIPGEGAIPTLMYEIAAGVQYLHSQNIVHGDLRGANILLDDQGHARLADFGLAVFADDPLAPTKRGGSLRWMAPELIHPQSCRLDIFQRTFASDMYAFGCVCLELYSGRPPFYDVASDGELLLKVIKGDRPEFPTTAPMWCAQMAAKCWAHHPLDRPGIGTIIEFIVNAARKRRRLEPEPTASESPHKKFKPNHSRRSSEGNSATFFHSRSSSSGSAYLSGDPAVYFKQRRDSESKRLSSHSNTYSE
ncbi:kinase-like domain-containing protein [Mycena filopes]|nr:kinase-like domain-containing protein [Mycena filopes]